jgi:hypothetical protein
VFVSLQAALSFTIGSTDTMGCVGAVACRLRTYAINNGGTIGLRAYNSLSGASLVGLNEGVLQTSQSGTGGGSTAQLLYCNISAVSAKAVRELGYIEITETTAGTWSANATFIQLKGPGVKKAGDIVQSFFNTSTATNSTTSTYTPSTTAPTTAAAVAAVSQAITPTDAANLISVDAPPVIASNNSNNFLTAFIYNGASVVSTRIGFSADSASNSTWTPSLLYQVLAGGTSQITFTAYGAGSANTTYVNETGSAVVVQNMPSTILVQGIMSALDRPANDNGSVALRMAG